jgi:hypothetical protein
MHLLGDILPRPCCRYTIVEGYDVLGAFADLIGIKNDIMVVIVEDKRDV